MTFKKFKDSINSQFKSMASNENGLFHTEVSKDVMWDLYLSSFPEGTNDIYKERSEHDCNACKSFIRRGGNVVTIENNKLVSIWDAPDLKHPYDIVAKKLSEYVKSSMIQNIYLSNESNLGIDKHKVILEDKTVHTFNHLFFKLPKKYVNTSKDSIGSIYGDARAYKDVFKRSMEELTLDSGETVLELIEQGSLYRGEEHNKAITRFIKDKLRYNATPDDEKDNWCWVNSINNPIAKIRNHAIGTLLTDLSNNVDLNVAVTKFEKVMAPTNYKRPKAIFTKKMVAESQKKIEELGYTESLSRKFASIEDITVNNVLYVDRDVTTIGEKSIFDTLADSVPVNPKQFSKVEEVSIKDFINKIVPKAKSIELMVESKHQNNLVSLIAPEYKNAACMLKWNNNFSWSYVGNITDSMKQNVEKAGGKIDGVLRFSIQWNDNGDNHNDFDAHCMQPNGKNIYFSNKKDYETTGQLDVDIIHPTKDVAVENITWTDINKMSEGIYTFSVHNYSHRGGKSGFTAEIEYDGQIYSYCYDKELKNNQKIMVAQFDFNKQKGLILVKSLVSTSTTTSKEIWNINTNQFVKVNSLMYSPNYWDDQKGIGNKHYFFFLDKCINDTSPRGFYNEFLKEELLTHKRVFEALGSKMKVEPSDNQLSGLGFSSTQKNDVIAKVEGKFSRIIKIIF